MFSFLKKKKQHFYRANFILRKEKKILKFWQKKNPAFFSLTGFPFFLFLI